MLTKMKEGIHRLITFLEQIAGKAREKLGPALKIGTIITAVYSVYATTVLIGCGFIGYELNWLTEYPGADLVMEIMLIISLATLVLSGSIVEALAILLWGLNAGISLASISFGSLIGLVIALILFILPLMLAGLVILCAPIIPILMHRYLRGTYDTE